MKKILGMIAGSLVAVLFIAIVSSFFYYGYATKKPLKGKGKVEVVVNEGDSLYRVIERLDDEEKLKNRVCMNIYMRLKGTSANILPGTFEVPADSSFEEMVAILEQEPEGSVLSVTIPEGYDIDRIGELFESKGIFSKAEFIEAVKAYPVPSYIPESTERRYDLEGFLFPDTYKFSLDVSPEEVIKTMLNVFEQRVVSIVGNKDDIYKYVTMASIIEGETMADDERSIVASVINNRISQGMMLQIDATVIYALGERVDTVLYKHLEVDSPYNTYRNYDLPVGPICSPGLESIKAAMNPVETDYLFYVLTEDGVHHYFTNDYQDFLNKQAELGY